MSALAAHLWQSTWFALIAALLAWSMRKEPARVRYWIWFAALLKFAVPFAAVGALGRHLVVQVESETALLPLVQQAAAPFVAEVFTTVSLDPFLALVIATAWAMGVFVVGIRWLREWHAICGIVKRGSVIAMDAPITTISSDEVSEPGLFGFVRARLLLPKKLLEELSNAELNAVIAHELQHVHRRDNLRAAFQTLIQAALWFHPLVWWIGKQLISTREQACDEAVLAAGHERTTYAQAIIRVCKHALGVREACVAHVADGNLAKRIGVLVSAEALPSSSGYRVALIAVAAFTTLSLPIVSGATVIALSQFSPAAGSHTIRISAGNEPAFVAVSNDFVYARNVSLRELIGHVYSVRLSRVQGRLISLDEPRYDVELSAPRGKHVDQRQLVAAALNDRFNLQLLPFPAVPHAQ